MVFENPNLRQLFQQPSIEIQRGKVSFQNNRMLCYKTIDAFVRNLGLRDNVSDSDISPISNGDKAICNFLILIEFIKNLRMFKVMKFLLI